MSTAIKIFSAFFLGAAIKIAQEFFVCAIQSKNLSSVPALIYIQFYASLAK
jgi:hypothetical protein